ncbi:MAG: YlxR family protein [Herpetosiphonaceae bacterium]|nr:YlxR family protein [Herpetosiphonaceae bacterium]
MPQRTCIACRRIDAKRGLVRLVRLPDERVAIDPTGKRAGRGAYICNDRSCWSAALKRKAIERALHITEFAPDDRAMLIAYHSALPDDSRDPEQLAAHVEREDGDEEVVTLEGGSIPRS